MPLVIYFVEVHVIGLLVVSLNLLKEPRVPFCEPTSCTLSSVNKTLCTTKKVN
jgi:hypothetical protein